MSRGIISAEAGDKKVDVTTYPDSSVALNVATISGMLVGIVFDDVQNTPSTYTDTFKFYLTGLLVATIVITYSDTAKNNFLRAQRT